MIDIKLKLIPLILIEIVFCINFINFRWGVELQNKQRNKSKNMYNYLNQAKKSRRNSGS